MHRTGSLLVINLTRLRGNDKEFYKVRADLRFDQNRQQQPIWQASFIGKGRFSIQSYCVRSVPGTAIDVFQLDCTMFLSALQTARNKGARRLAHWRIAHRRLAQRRMAHRRKAHRRRRKAHRRRRFAHRRRRFAHRRRRFAHRRDVTYTCTTGMTRASLVGIVLC